MVARRLTFFSSWGLGAGPTEGLARCDMAAKKACNCFRPRDSWLLEVLTSTPSISAISLWEYPSTRYNCTTVR